MPMSLVTDSTSFGLNSDFGVYKDKTYSICEPTPQKDFNIGQLSSNLNNMPYKIFYAYRPGIKIKPVSCEYGSYSQRLVSLYLYSLMGRFL